MPLTISEAKEWNISISRFVKQYMFEYLFEKKLPQLKEAMFQDTGGRVTLDISKVTLESFSCEEKHIYIPDRMKVIWICPILIDNEPVSFSIPLEDFFKWYRNKYEREDKIFMFPKRYESDYYMNRPQTPPQPQSQTKP